MPPFQRLKDETLRARLLSLRASLTPILATNLMRHFTDHSVAHSDQICDLIDHLTSPMSAAPLTDIEAFIIYAAAYVHDVGMQHERCDETLTIGNILNGPPFFGRKWIDLEERTRYDLLRRFHHRISAEMVKSCLDAPQPTILGIQLTRQDYTGFIAALAEAHCEPTDTPRYAELTQEGPNIRMPLLAGLLRLADILDESQRRTQISRELTVQLDHESRMHWWRHYYVAEVTFHPDLKHFKIWFDFPPDRRSEYTRLIPELQRPWIEAELIAHRSVLTANEIGWYLEVSEVSSVHSTAVPMPPEVQLRMVQELEGRRRAKELDDRLVALQQLENAQAIVAECLDNIRASTAKPVEKLQLAESLVQQLKTLGGLHDASMIFYEVYSSLRDELSIDDKITYGQRLGELLLTDRMQRLAASVLADIQPVVDKLPVTDKGRITFNILWGRTALANAVIDEARCVLSKLQSSNTPTDILTEFELEVEEAVMISGQTSGGSGETCH
jgi:hypothetical protein